LVSDLHENLRLWGMILYLPGTAFQLVIAVLLVEQRNCFFQSVAQGMVSEGNQCVLYY
jgi:hypothetical protein